MSESKQYFIARAIEHRAFAFAHRTAVAALSIRDSDPVGRTRAEAIAREIKNAEEYDLMAEEIEKQAASM